MSHITCPKCGGNEHMSGYGFAGGVFGGYTLCDCGVVLDLLPDTDGVPDDRAAEMHEAAKQILAETWGKTA